MEQYWSPLLACYAPSHLEAIKNCNNARKQPAGVHPQDMLSIVHYCHVLKA